MNHIVGFQLKSRPRHFTAAASAFFIILIILIVVIFSNASAQVLLQGVEATQLLTPLATHRASWLFCSR